MIRGKLKTAGTLVFAIVLLVGCGDKNDGNPVGPVGTKLTDYNMSYKIAGNKIIVDYSIKTAASNYCVDTLLVHRNDTTYSMSDTSEYALSGNTLKFISAPETMSVSKAVIVPYMQLTRKGSGTGIIGVWNNLTSGYNLVSGILTTSDKQNIDQFVQAALSGLTYEYEFTSTQYFYYISGELDMAERFIYNWNYTVYMDTFIYPSDNSLYDITLKEISNKKITLTGNKTNEVVTITWNMLSSVTSLYDPKYTEVITSSNQLNEAHTYYSDPVSCPNKEYPSWYNSFLSANMKMSGDTSFAKKSVYPLKRSNQTIKEFVLPHIR